MSARLVTVNEVLAGHVALDIGVPGPKDARQIEVTTPYPRQAAATGRGDRRGAGFPAADFGPVIGAI